MKWLNKLKAGLWGYNKLDPDLVNAYRTSIPSSIDLQVSLRGDSYIATIKSIENEKLPKETFLITEARSQEALVDMVNDLIFSYKNIPEIYRPAYGRILKPQGSITRTESLKLMKVA
jgi:mevalonate kinase